jgi:putative FmdB family regulatory protein
MPLYEYECLQCGKRTELLQRFSDAPLAACPHCGGEVKKLISAPAVQFKGTGWYVTDYAGKKGGGSEGKGGRSESKGESASGSSGSSESKSSGSSESSGSSGSSGSSDSGSSSSSGSSGSSSGSSGSSGE